MMRSPAKTRGSTGPYKLYCYPGPGETCSAQSLHLQRFVDPSWAIGIYSDLGQTIAILEYWLNAQRSMAWTTVWKTKRQVYLLCPRERHSAGLPTLKW